LIIQICGLRLLIVSNMLALKLLHLVAKIKRDENPAKKKKNL